MDLHAFSCISIEAESAIAAEELAHAVAQSFRETPLKLLIVYATMNHEQAEVLKVFRTAFPAPVEIVGCSTQGVMCDGQIQEGGYALGVMGLGGEALAVATAVQREIQVDGHAKGRSMAVDLMSRLSQEPKLTLMLWDPLCGADAELVLAGMRVETGSPVIGGAAAAPFGRAVRTAQYWSDEILTHSAVTVGLTGPFSFQLGVSHGTSPMGFGMTLTRAEGNRLIEIDGKPALQSWRDVTGCADGLVMLQDNSVNWAIGIRNVEFQSDGTERFCYIVRAPVGFDLQAETIIVPAAIPEGTHLMFHHRTVHNVLEGTAAMGRDLAMRLKAQTPWAVLGFECGARTAPFLGPAATAEENRSLRDAVAPTAPWLGMMPWGEIAPTNGVSTAHNYTYPLVVLCV